MSEPQDPFIRPVRARRAFEEILDQLQQAIAAGHLTAGDRLPAERELAAQFGVARTSVREAIRVLEALGVVQVRRGADHGATLREEPGEAFTRLFDLLVSLRHVSVPDVVGFRAMIESWAAASPLDPEGELLSDLDALVTRMEQDDLGRMEFHELDASFHRRLVAASGNDLVMLVLEGSRRSIERLILQAVLEHGDWPPVRAELAAEHRAILDAIEDGPRGDAARLVRAHVERWGARAAELLGRESP